MGHALSKSKKKSHRAKEPVRGIQITFDREKDIIHIEDGTKSFDISSKDVIAAVPLSEHDKNPASKGYSIAYVRTGKSGTDKEEDRKDAVPEFKSIVVETLPEDLKHIVATGPSISAEKLTVIVSILSGTCQAQPFFDKSVKQALAHIGYGEKNKYAVHTTTSAKSVTEHTRDVLFPLANEGKSQHVVLMSGDGGIVDIVNSILTLPLSENYKPPVISIIPMGTGNALAHSIGNTKDDTWGLSSLARGSPHPLPLFKATFSPGARILTEEATQEEEISSVDGTPTMYGAVVCSWGMHAGLVADSDTEEYRKYGIDRFKMAAKEALYPSDGSPPHAYKGKVSILPSGTDTWQPIPREEHMYVLATMVSNLEQTFTISPASTPLGGQLRLVHFAPTTADETMRILGLAYQNGKHVEDPAVGYEDIDGMRIEFAGLEDDARWRRVCLDGKIIRVEKDGFVELRKDKKHVIDIVR